MIAFAWIGASTVLILTFFGFTTLMLRRARAGLDSWRSIAGVARDAAAAASERQHG